MITADYHIHSDYSFDSKEPMYQSVEKAISLGLKEIAFTDHFETFDPNESLENIIDYGEYKERLDRLQQEYPDIRILLGSEINLEMMLKDQINQIIHKYDFDFIIGSVHNIDFVDVGTKEFYQGLSVHEYHERYFERIVQLVHFGFDYSVLGHLDFVTRYGGYPNNHVDIQRQKMYLESILKKVIEDGKGLEINTSGLRYGVGDVHPSKEILQLYKDLGGEIITVGSDSHYAKTIAQDFDKAEAILQSVGFRYYTVFRKMKPEFIKLG